MGGFDAAFCALGAYNKEDGPELTRKVDFDYVVAVADLAERCGVKSFTLLSASEADATISESATSNWQVYKRMKGLAIDAVMQKSIERVYVYKPGILFGRFSAENV